MSFNADGVPDRAAANLEERARSERETKSERRTRERAGKLLTTEVFDGKSEASLASLFRVSPSCQAPVFGRARNPAAE